MGTRKVSAMTIPVPAAHVVDDVRKAWLTLLLGIPVAFFLAFGVGEGLLSALGYDPADPLNRPPFWAGAISTIPALLVFAAPAFLATRFARRAAGAGDRRGWLPAGIAIALAVAFVVLNTVPLGQ
jgi:hypothetical protein